MTIRVKVRYPNGRVAYFPFPGATCLVGRAPDSDVQIRTSAVSWRHLRMQRRGEEVLVEDLGSSAGTTVGDRPLLRGVVRAVDFGESIWIDQFEIQVEPADSPTEVGASRGDPEPEASAWQPPPPTPSPDPREPGAAFGGWLNELSTLPADSGVEVSVERTRVTVKPPAPLLERPPEKVVGEPPAGVIDVEPLERLEALEGPNEVFAQTDPSDLPTAKVPALTAGPRDATIRVERPDLDALTASRDEEVLRVPVPRAIGAAPPDVPSRESEQHRPRSAKSVPTWQMVSHSPEMDAGGPPQVPVRAFEQRIQQSATAESFAPSSRPGSSAVPWGGLLKGAGVIALILGLAGVILILVELVL